MGELVEINQGEIKIKFSKPVAGKVTLAELGVKNEDLYLEGGNMRMVFDMEGIGEHHYYQVPTVEIGYRENVAETHWICEFNGETILDKLDHHGQSTVLLLNRKTLEGLEHHHENALVIHADFPEPVHISAEDTYVNFFK